MCRDSDGNQRGPFREINTHLTTTLSRTVSIFRMQHDPLTIEDVHSEESRILRLHGPITISNLFDFQARVRSNTSRTLILDLSGVSYIDSAGIGALVGAYVNHNKDNRSLAPVGVNDRVLGTLQITRVDQFFRRFDSIAAAEQAVR
jgi:anti-sigma B factor antagonist